MSIFSLNEHPVHFSETMLTLLVNNKTKRSIFDTKMTTQQLRDDWPSIRRQCDENDKELKRIRKGLDELNTSAQGYLQGEEERKPAWEDQFAKSYGAQMELLRRVSDKVHCCDGWRKELNGKVPITRWLLDGDYGSQVVRLKETRKAEAKQPAGNSVKSPVPPAPVPVSQAATKTTQANSQAKATDPKIESKAPKTESKAAGETDKNTDEKEKKEIGVDES
jgi:hypothetical protein